MEGVVVDNDLDTPEKMGPICTYETPGTKTSAELDTQA